MVPARMRGAVVIAAASAVLAGCGGSNHARRDAVNAYIDRVEAAQAPLRNERGPIGLALQRFSIQSNSPRELRALIHARRVLSSAVMAVRAVQPPPEAHRLHADLVQMLELQTSTASELVAIVQYEPRLAGTLSPLTPAGTALTEELRKAKGWVPLTAAFAHYRTAIEGVIGDLDGLSPPPTLRPGFEAERSALQRTVDICRSIEARLAAHDVQAASRGIAQLQGGSVDAATRLARSHADQVAAVKAYDRRLKRIAGLERRVARERQRLVGALG